MSKHNLPASDVCTQFCTFSIVPTNGEILYIYIFVYIYIYIYIFPHRALNVFPESLILSIHHSFSRFSLFLSLKTVHTSFVPFTSFIYLYSGCRGNIKVNPFITTIILSSKRVYTKVKRKRVCSLHFYQGIDMFILWYKRKA